MLERYLKDIKYKLYSIREVVLEVEEAIDYLNWGGIIYNTDKNTATGDHTYLNVLSSREEGVLDRRFFNYDCKHNEVDWQWHEGDRQCISVYHLDNWDKRGISGMVSALYTVLPYHLPSRDLLIGML